MTTDDFDRTARLWLDDGPTELSDRALEAALAEIHVTRQRRAWWPAQRFPAMTNLIRIAAVVGAVAIATVLGTSLLPGGIGSTPTPSPTPSPRVITDTSTSLTPGTYVSGAPFLARVTFTVRAGWDAQLNGPYRFEVRKAGDSPIGIAFDVFDKVYADPCHYEQGLLDPLPGPSVNDLATALASLPGFEATTPTDVTIDGYAGKQLDLTAPASFDGCTMSPEGYLLWELPLGATQTFLPGQRDRIWIVDVAGQRLVIDVLEVPGRTPQDDADIQAILDSIQLAPAN